MFLCKKIKIQETIFNFRTSLLSRGNTNIFIQKGLKDVKFFDRKLALGQRDKTPRTWTLPHGQAAPYRSTGFAQHFDYIPPMFYKLNRDLLGPKTISVTCKSSSSDIKFVLILKQDFKIYIILSHIMASLNCKLRLINKKS